MSVHKQLSVSLLDGRGEIRRVRGCCPGWEVVGGGRVGDVSDRGSDCGRVASNWATCGRDSHLSSAGSIEREVRRVWMDRGEVESRGEGRRG